MYSSTSLFSGSPLRALSAALDRSLSSNAAVFVAGLLPVRPGHTAMVESLLHGQRQGSSWSRSPQPCQPPHTLGRFFGIRPALRGSCHRGRAAPHPMYLSYVMGDIGYNLQEWNSGTVLLTLAGWGASLYRIHAEERVLSGQYRMARLCQPGAISSATRNPVADDIAPG